MIPLKRPIEYTYVRIGLSSNTEFDPLLLRKALQDALNQTFGLSFAGAQIDILSLHETGSETNDASIRNGDAVARVAKEDASKIMGAIAASKHTERLSMAVLDSADFLPSLLLAANTLRAP
ncbi:hypothetical protein SCHPADRAFT_900332 [Schizopora paradoxa]|uniref:Ribonucleases P/MRP subunit Pop8-like domain-containing protein n=1 Tax=Schizopora paradoxa TaxID=27342 RepID=A0A0H2S7Y8_9AGAM|nr:hypothetical protein SCHPADRAFT_900332 [Schizopora paradoxa]